MHDQKMQVVEIVLFDQEVDNSPKDGVESDVGIHPAQEIS
ncbi:MAG: hypothetical protein RL413_208, partial [Actinomycetota bacterium]